MLSGFLTKINKWLYVAGAAALAVLYAVLRINSLKHSRDKAQIKADTLTATVHAHKVRRQISKEEDKKLSSRRAEIIKEIKKEGEEFEGVDSLTNPNDWD